MTLNFSIHEIFSGFLYACCLGCFFGLIYDFIRLIRVLLGTIYRGRFIQGPFSRLSTPIETKVKAFREKHRAYRMFVRVLDIIFDFLYFLFCGMCYAVFLYAVNHGIFRLVFLVGTVLGFWTYRKTVGRIFFFLLRETSAICYLLLYGMISILRQVVIRPLKWIFSRIFFPIYRKILLPFRKKYGTMNKNKEC